MKISSNLEQSISLAIFLAVTSASVILLMMFVGG